MEVEVAAKFLVGALARENHLDAQRLDLPREDEHGCACARRACFSALGVDRVMIIGVPTQEHGSEFSWVWGVE